MEQAADQLSSEHVWIVCHDESPDNTVLGVFRTGEEAENYADEIEHMFENGVIFSSFPIGYRHIDEVSRYRIYEPPSATSGESA